MSNKKMQLRIVTPHKTVVDIAVEAVGANGSEGAFTVLPGHLAFLTDLQPGLLWYRLDGEDRNLAVSGGFVEVKPDHVSVLADSAEYLEDIDVERAEKAMKRAEEQLAIAKATAESSADKASVLKEIDRASANLTRAATRIRLAAKKIR